MTLISRQVGVKQAVSTREINEVKRDGKGLNEEASIAQDEGVHQSWDHSCDVQKLANEGGHRKSSVLISVTGRSGHCDIDLYGSGDLLSCDIFLRKAMLASTGREYLERAKMAFGGIRRHICVQQILVNARFQSDI